MERDMQTERAREDYDIVWLCFGVVTSSPGSLFQGSVCALCTRTHTQMYAFNAGSNAYSRSRAGTHVNLQGRGGNTEGCGVYVVRDQNCQCSEACERNAAIVS